MRVRLTLLLSLQLLWLTSCTEPNEERLRLLVGEGKLKASAALPDETIRLSLVNLSGNPNRHLDLILDPRGTLSVERYQLNWPEDLSKGPKITTESKEKLVLSREQSADFRRRLSVLRPERLSEDGPFVLPRDCHFISDGSSRAVVAFYSSRTGGYFILQDGCDEMSAKQLEEHLRRIVSSLPPTKTAKDFRWEPAGRAS